MEKMTFWGYRRPDGRVGIRNKILILPASVCASDTTRIIASQVESAVTFNNQNGCSQVPSDQQFTMDVMAGYAANPNVYGTVVVSLGWRALPPIPIFTVLLSFLWGVKTARWILC